MKKFFYPEYEYLHSNFDVLLKNFKNSGELIGSEKRNVIKVFRIDNLLINIKSFKKPNFFNSIIYGYFRKSKAQRSFEYAKVLLENGIGTPQPFAYYEKKTFTGLKASYYFSNHQDVDCEFRKVIFDTNYPDRPEVVKQLARFFFRIHNLGIEFIDNTAGNTLVKKIDSGNYLFYLVDLNRMKFHTKLNLQQRASNLAKLTTEESINKMISEEYAKLIKVSKDDFYDLLQNESERFLDNFNRRKKIKKKLKFWKK